MAESAKVVVIGGGIVGCSVLYALAKRGWTDTLLCERLELTSGSTWHAAGNVTHFGHYAEITRVYVESLETYLEAERESGQSVGFHATGSLRLANSRAELNSYRTLLPLYEDLGINYRVINAEEVGDLNPLVQLDGLFGAAHTPDDGHVDASSTTMALAKAARNMGAEIRCQCPVRSIGRLRDGRWQVDTEFGAIETANIVLAASFWTRELALPLGLDLPLYALEHHEVVTDDVPALKSLNCEVPAIRDPRSQANVRQERFSLLCGVYESQPVLWAAEGIPSDFGGELLVPDLERLEENLMHVIERIPAFGDVGIKIVNNGPMCFPPDGCPLVGPIEGFAGLWLAAGFPVGIGTGGGSGRFLADWMVNGQAPYELAPINPARFAKQIPVDEAFARMKATYSMGYVMPGKCQSG